MRCAANAARQRQIIFGHDRQADSVYNEADLSSAEACFAGGDSDSRPQPSKSQGGKETKTIVVNEILNQPPIINTLTGVQTSFSPITVKFTENSSDIDGFIEKWEWNYGDGSDIFSTTSSLEKNPTHIYNSPGT